MKKVLYLISIIFVAMFAASCAKDDAMDMDNVGYVRLKVMSNTSSITRAAIPNGYDPKLLDVEILDANGTVVENPTADLNESDYGERIPLKPGKYRINVHSANWDGDNSGFDAPYYAGSTEVDVVAKSTVSAKVTCTLANVEVTVVYDESISKFFETGKTTISSGSGKSYPLVFELGKNNASGYFPADVLNWQLSLTNKSSHTEHHTEIQTITGVKARDHYTIRFALEEKGWMGPGANPSESWIKVTVNGKTNNFSFDVPVSTKPSVTLSAKNPVESNVWSTFVTSITGALDMLPDNFDKTKVGCEYKADADDAWTKVTTLTVDDEGNIETALKGLNAGTKYNYRFTYTDNNDNTVTSNVVTFTTDTEYQLYNASFEDWNKVKKSWFPNEAGKSYWDSSNPGSAAANTNVTVQDTDFKHSGSSSAKLGSTFVSVLGIGKFAAASLFTGVFQGLIGMDGGKLDWGMPCTSRPTALKGYMSFAPGSINRGDKPNVAGAPSKGDTDPCQIFCCLLTEVLKVGGNSEEGDYKKSTVIDWDNDPRIIAYGEMTKTTSSNGQWEEFNIPLKYHDLNKKPAYILVVCSSSKYGDYFYGSDQTVLHLDDFELVYGEPTTK